MTLSSALRWQPCSEIWPADHADEIGHNLDTLDAKTPPPGFDHLDRYEEVVKRASAA